MMHSQNHDAVASCRMGRLTLDKVTDPAQSGTIGLGADSFCQLGAAIICQELLRITSRKSRSSRISIVFFSNSN